MANARIAQLQEQRNAARGISSGKIRLLSAANTSIASIAKRTASSELNIMVSRYNAGEIENDEMREFLAKTQSNPSLSASDRLDIDTQIKEFDNRIQKDKLEATYRAAPDNSMQQYQAAGALSQYYKTKAAGMASETPAQSDAFTMAAQYDQRVADIQQNVQTKARQNQRYIAEQQINQLPNSSSERSGKRAEMYKQLYDQAVADGDQTDANKYAAAYQQELTNTQAQANQEAEAASKEEISTEKKTLRDYMGSLVNDYHDGKIGEAQYLQALSEISPRIDATNDYGLINSLNRTTDIIQKNLDKGGVRRGTTVSGLPFVLGKGKGGGVGGVVTDWDKQDYDYSDSMRKLTSALNDGTKSPADVLKTMQLVIKQRNDDIQTQIQNVEAIAAENPNAKVLFNGRKTRAADVVDSLYKEYQKLEDQAGVVLNGNPKNLALVMVPPGEFTTTGNIAKNGKSFSTFELIDRTNVPSDTAGQPQYFSDNQGIFHKGENRKVAISKEDYDINVMSDPARFTQDKKTGQYLYLENEKTVRVYDQKTNKYFDTAPDKDGVVPNYASSLAMKTQDEVTKKMAARREKEKQTSLDLVTKQKQSNAKQPLEQFKNAFGAARPVLNSVNPALALATDVVKGAVGVVQPTATAQEPVTSKNPVVIAPKTAQQIGISQNTQISMPKQIIPTQTGTILPQVKTPTLKVAVPAPTPIQKAVASGQLPKNVKIQAPLITPARAAQKPQISLGPVDFFKKLLKIK